MSEDNYLVTLIKNVREEMKKFGGSEENLRLKAIVNTKLQEAQYIAEHLNDKE